MIFLNFINLINNLYLGAELALSQPTSNLENPDISLLNGNYKL